MSEVVLTDGKLDRPRLMGALDRFLRLLVEQTGLALQYEIQELPALQGGGDIENPEVLAVFRGADEELLLERNAELLKAIEYIALRWLKLPSAYHDRVRLECGEWRATHLEELKLAAQVAAERVRQTRQPFRFNPMPARDRRVIHLALQHVLGVRTASEGTGADRHTVVYPAD